MRSESPQACLRRCYAQADWGLRELRLELAGSRPPGLLNWALFQGTNFPDFCMSVPPSVSRKQEAEVG